MAGRQRRDEDLPDAAGAQPHGIAPPVPIVEIADDADALRIGRPDREGDAVRAVMLAAMSAQHIVAFVMGALAEKIDVEIAEHRRKGVDILELRRAELALGAEPIAEARTVPQHAGPQPVLMDARELAGDLARRGLDDPEPPRPGQEDAHAETAAHGMHPEIGEGIAAPRLENGARAGAKRGHGCRLHRSWRGRPRAGS